MLRFLSISMAMAVLLGGCAGAYVGGGVSANDPINVRGHLPDLHFRLTDDTGRTVTQDAWRGQTTLLYFGYTGCGAECPVTLARLAEVTHRLATTGPAPRVLFVTVTPDTDQPAVLHAYLARFDSAHMSGLTGRSPDVAALARDLRAAWPQPGGASHGDLVYVFDAQGQARFVITPQDSDSGVVRAVKSLSHG